MGEEELEFIDDKLYVYTPLPQYDGEIYKKQLVMTKEIFRACYERWIEPQESDRKCHNCKHYTSGEHDGSCGSYICKHYSNWESEDER